VRKNAAGNDFPGDQCDCNRKSLGDVTQSPHLVKRLGAQTTGTCRIAGSDDGGGGDGGNDGGDIDGGGGGAFAGFAIGGDGDGGGGGNGDDRNGGAWWWQWLCTWW